MRDETVIQLKVPTMFVQVMDLTETNSDKMHPKDYQKHVPCFLREAKMDCVHWINWK